MASPPQIARLDVEVDGGRLAAFRLGSEEPALPAVVAVHGITSSSRSWLAVLRALDGRVALIAPDLRGRGASNGLPGPCGLATHAADLLALIDQLELEQAFLVGHSMGAYVIARLAAEHPGRVRSLLMVDGGLTIPGSQDVEPQAFADAFLGPALARLRMQFASREEYHQWWRSHPALAGSDVDDLDLVAYADHDLVGEAPQLHSPVSEAAVRDDAGELGTMGDCAHRLRVPATMLCALRGLQNDPNPMQPMALAEAWVAESPDQRQARLVPGVNHYTITLGARGAAAVASAITDALEL
jgi:lipase